MSRKEALKELSKNRYRESLQDYMLRHKISREEIERRRLKGVDTKHKVEVKAKESFAKNCIQYCPDPRKQNYYGRKIYASKVIQEKSNISNFVFWLKYKNAQAQLQRLGYIHIDKKQIRDNLVEQYEPEIEMLVNYGRQEEAVALVEKIKKETELEYRRQKQNLKEKTKKQEQYIQYLIVTGWKDLHKKKNKPV